MNNQVQSSLPRRVLTTPGWQEALSGEAADQKTEYDGGEELFCLQWLCRHVVGALLVRDVAWDKLLLDEAKL